MSDFSFEISMHGHELVSRKFAKASVEIGDWTPLWGQVAAWFVAMEAEVFATEGRGAWAELQPSTQRERARRGYGPAHPILEETGKLAASLVGGQGHVRYETALSITLGTEIPYAKYHQSGTGRMAARRPLGIGQTGSKIRLSQTDTSVLRKLFSEYVHNLVTQKVSAA